MLLLIRRKKVKMKMIWIPNRVLWQCPVLQRTHDISRKAEDRCSLWEEVASLNEYEGGFRLNELKSAILTGKTDSVH